MLKKILASVIAGAAVFAVITPVVWQKRGAIMNYIMHRNTPEYVAIEYMTTLQKGMYKSMSSCATQEAENKMRNFAILSEPDLPEDEAVAKHLDELSSILKDAAFSIAEDEKSEDAKSEQNNSKIQSPVSSDGKDADAEKKDEDEVKTLDVKVVVKWKDSSSETVTLQMVKDKRGRWRCNTPF